jgi:para-nitrobenzyl esterase
MQETEAGMTINRCAATMLLGVIAVSAAAAAERPQVHTESGTLAGQSAGAVVAFKGIPYAAAPVGDSRWREPRRPPRWAGVREAVEFGAACPQDPALGGNPQPRAEDCLFLNVWAPAALRGGHHPVMVWIHGGGFVAGAGSQQLYDGENFARDGIVLVTINYRLGSLGFFAHPALGGGGNYGLMDQIAALKWVRRNIAAFGGDPQRVTLFGESAGGGSVLFLLASSAASGLFQQAIAESAPGYKVPKSQATEESDDIQLAAAAGVAATGTAAQLRAVPPEKLFGDYTKAGPFIDGALVERFPLAAWEAGTPTRIPLIIGSNSDEGSLVKVYPQTAPQLLRKLGDGAAELRSAYGAVGEDEPRFERELVGDVIFGAASRRIASQHSARAPTFLYRFAYVTAAQRDQRPGASHVSEIPYVFDTLAHWPWPSTEEDQAMAKRVHSCWVQFAKTGRPACDTDGAWSGYEPAQDNTLIFTPTGSRVERGYRARQFDAVQAAFYDRDTH